MMTDETTQETAPKKGRAVKTKERKESVTLTFATQEELDAFDALTEAANKDERTLSKYIVRLLRNQNSTETTK